MEISEDGYHMGDRLAPVGPNIQHATKAAFKKAQARWLEEISEDDRLEIHRDNMAYLWHKVTNSEWKTGDDTDLQAPTDFLYRARLNRLNNNHVGYRAFMACDYLFTYEKLDAGIITRVIRMGKIYGEFFGHPDVEEECKTFLDERNPERDNEPTLDYDYWLRMVRQIFKFGPDADLQNWYYQREDSYFDEDMEKLNYNSEYIKWNWSQEKLTELGGILDKRIHDARDMIEHTDDVDHFIQGALIMALTYFLTRYYAEDKE